MRRSVFAKADRVVRHHVDDGLPHQGREPNRRAGIVRKHEERGSVGPQATVQRHTRGGRRHDVLPNPPPHVAARVIGRTEVPGRLYQRVVGRSQVRTAADQPRQVVGDRVQRDSRRLAGGHGAVGFIERRKPGIPSGWEPAIDRILELFGQLRVSRAIGVEAGAPVALGIRAPVNSLSHVFECPIGYQEVRVLGPSVGPLGELDLLFAKWRAVHTRGVLLVGRSEADVRAHDDQGRPVGLRPRCIHGCPESVHVVGRVTQVLHMPAVRREASRGVVGVRKVRGAVDRDPVVIIEDDQLPEAQVAGERAGFVGRSLHEIAVAAHDVREVIDDVV